MITSPNIKDCLKDMCSLKYLTFLYLSAKIYITTDRTKKIPKIHNDYLFYYHEILISFRESSIKLKL